MELLVQQQMWILSNMKYMYNTKWIKCKKSRRKLVNILFHHNLFANHFRKMGLSKLCFDVTGVRLCWYDSFQNIYDQKTPFQSYMNAKKRMQFTFRSLCILISTAIWIEFFVWSFLWKLKTWNFWKKSNIINLVKWIRKYEFI